MNKGKRKTSDGMVRYSTFLRPEQIDRMKAIHVERGVPVAEQIRRAIDVALKGGKG